MNRTALKPNRLSSGRARPKCPGACRRAHDQLSRTRAAILAAASARLKDREHLVRLALNEAESLAWQTSYPHLVFPTLAMEKVEMLAAWDERQKRVLEASPILSLSA